MRIYGFRQRSGMWAGLLFVACALATAGCAGRVPPTTGASSGAPFESGMASWYGKRFQGRPTASGERFDMNALTAAHRSLSFGTRVRVVHRATGQSVVVRINDRGPFVDGRIIDLSRAAARRLGIIEEGVAPVSLYLDD